jgi:alanine dehydrogenase
MRIGIIREGKVPPDKRVPFTPEQCKQIKETYPGVDLRIQESNIRAFKDSEYEAAGLRVVTDLADAEVIFGVKEVQLEDLLASKIYFFFSHTIKKQPYNRKLLQTVLERKIRLIDYETLTNAEGRRLVGFGRYAGIVGTYNAFLAYGKRTGNYALKAANLCEDRVEMEGELDKIALPKDYKIVLTGLGRVAGGAKEILAAMNVREVSPQDFLQNEYQEAVYTQLSVEDYFKKTNNEAFDREEVYQHAERFESNFFPYARVADMYIPCHYWDAKGPGIFTVEEMQSPDFKIRTIADISCDIAGPIPSTIRPSTIAEPIYEYDVKQLEEVATVSANTITVMAVDNLPCELPKDASEDFGGELIKHILPCLIGEDPDKVLERATIAENGELTAYYKHLEAYVRGTE